MFLTLLSKNQKESLNSIEISYKKEKKLYCSSVIYNFFAASRELGEKLTRKTFGFWNPEMIYIPYDGKSGLESMQLSDLFAQVNQPAEGRARFPCHRISFLLKF